LHLRGTLIEQLARFDDAATVREAMRLFDRDEAGTPIPASIRAAVVRAVGQHADRAHFDRLVARLKAADSEEDRQLYRAALASGRDAARAAELLDACLAGSRRPMSRRRSRATWPACRRSASWPTGTRSTTGSATPSWPARSNKVWLLPKAATAFTDEPRPRGSSRTSGRGRARRRRRRGARGRGDPAARGGEGAQRDVDAASVRGDARRRRRCPDARGLGAVRRFVSCVGARRTGHGNRADVCAGACDSKEQNTPSALFDARSRFKLHARTSVNASGPASSAEPVATCTCASCSDASTATHAPPPRRRSAT
jgi:hypothetical protein